MRAATLAGAIGALGLTIAGAAMAQSAEATKSATHKATTPKAAAAKASNAGKQGADAAARAADGHIPHDRRLKAVQGADSAALPNVDAKAAANQIQIPDYPPVDRDEVGAVQPPAPK